MVYKKEYKKLSVWCITNIEGLFTQNVFGLKGVFHLKRSYFWVKYPFKFKDETHFVSLAAAARSAGEAPPHSSSPLKEKDKQTLS